MPAIAGQPTAAAAQTGRDRSLTSTFSAVPASARRKTKQFPVGVVGPSTVVATQGHVTASRGEARPRQPSPVCGIGSQETGNKDHVQPRMGASYRREAAMSYRILVRATEWIKHAWLGQVAVVSEAVPEALGALLIASANRFLLERAVHDLKQPSTCGRHGVRRDNAPQSARFIADTISITEEAALSVEPEVPLRRSHVPVVSEPCSFRFGDDKEGRSVSLFESCWQHPCFEWPISKKSNNSMLTEPDFAPQAGGHLG